MRRRYRLPGTGLLLASMVFSAAPAAAAGLVARVQDDAGGPVAEAVVYATPRTDAPVSRAQDARERPPRGDKPARPTPKEEPATMVQRNRQFMPYVLPVQVGTPVLFPNSDNTRHHVYSFSPAKSFELMLYKGTPSEPVVFDKPGAVALGCNIHDWMVGYIYVVDSPYFGKTAGNGEIRLTDLPAGEYDLRVWHPRLKEPVDKTLRRVTLSAGGETRVEFVLGLSPDRRKDPPASYERKPSGYNY